MVTEISIKSPVPGKDGQTGGGDEQREELRQRGGRRSSHAPWELY